MRLFNLLLLSLSAWTALAQLPALPLQTFVSSVAAPYSPTNVANARYYWNFNDVPLNVKVTNWVDRIQGAVLTNQLNTLRPTNSSAGVGFDGTTYLSNNPTFFFADTPGSTGTVFIITTPITPTTSFGGLVIGDTQAGGGRGIFTRSSAIYQYFGVGGNGSFGPLVSGTMTDLILTSAGTTLATILYTNNVITTTLASAGGYSDQFSVGFDPSTTGFFKGKIAEIVFYYGVISSTSRSNLHWYATNTYGYAP